MPAMPSLSTSCSRKNASDAGSFRNAARTSPGTQLLPGVASLWLFAIGLGVIAGSLQNPFDDGLEHNGGDGLFDRSILRNRSRLGSLEEMIEIRQFPDREILVASGPEGRF